MLSMSEERKRYLTGSLMGRLMNRSRTHFRCTASEPVAFHWEWTSVHATIVLEEKKGHPKEEWNVSA